jgi:hypothetical protein
MLSGHEYVACAAHATGPVSSRTGTADFDNLRAIMRRPVAAMAAPDRRKGRCRLVARTGMAQPGSRLPKICSHPAATDRAATPTESSMIALNPLCTMTVTLKEPLDAGNVPTGQRVITEIADASLSGRLSGSLAGGSSADWLTMTRGGLGLPDVRMAIRTNDNAVVLMRYSGRIRFVPRQASIV